MATAVVAGLVALAALLSWRQELGGVEQTGTRPTSSGSVGPAPDAPASDGSGTAPRLQGAPRRAPPAPRTRRGPLQVTVVDPQGRPLAGVLVAQGSVMTLGTRERLFATREEVTDGAGHAGFEEVAYDGTEGVEVAVAWGEHATALAETGGRVFVTQEADSALRVWRVAGRPTPDREDPAPWGNATRRTSWARVAGPEVRLVVAPGVPLDVDLVHAATGRSVPDARWRATPRFGSDDGGWGPASVPRNAESVTVEVEPPADLVGPPQELWGAVPHLKTRRYWARTPLRPPVEVVVQFPAEFGAVREGDWIPEVVCAGAPVAKPRLQGGADGELRVGGLPHHVGDVITLGGRLRGGLRTAGSAVMGPDPDLPLRVRLRFESPAGEPARGALGPVGVTLPLVRGRAQQVEYAQAAPQRGAACGALRLTVQMPDGGPAARARVTVGGQVLLTDALGRADADRLPVGPLEVRVEGAGATTETRVEIRPDQRVEAVVRAGLGGTVEVEVVDSLDRPLPFASLYVVQPSGCPWADLDGDVQRLDPYTDERGRRTLSAVEPGLNLVSARFGSRVARAEVEVSEGTTARLRLVLPALDAPPASPATPRSPPSPPADTPSLGR